MKLLVAMSLWLATFICQAQWIQDGDNATTGNLTINGSYTSFNNYGLLLQPSSGDAVIKRSSSGNLMISSGGGSSDIRFNYNYGGGNGGVYIFDGGVTNNVNLKINSGGNLLMTPSGGNVGIGGSPAKKLDIGNFQNGAIKNNVVLRVRNSIAQNQASGWGSSIEFFNQCNNVENDPRYNEGGAKIISEASEYGWSHGLKFRVVKNNNFTSQTGTDAMIINTSGNIGIGTTDPGSFKLAVNGKIWTQEVNVQMNNPGPDYVFEKDYNLLPLNEVEHYIAQNKHLPEVPSAKEMESEGLNLKEMNLILLKKVEELTLHLIDANKKIEALQQDKIETDSKLKELESRIKP